MPALIQNSWSSHCMFTIFPPLGMLLQCSWTQTSAFHNFLRALQSNTLLLLSSPPLSLGVGGVVFWKQPMEEFPSPSLNPPSLFLFCTESSIDSGIVWDWWPHCYLQTWKCEHVSLQHGSEFVERSPFTSLTPQVYCLGQIREGGFFREQALKQKRRKWLRFYSLPFSAVLSTLVRMSPLFSWVAKVGGVLHWFTSLTRQKIRLAGKFWSGGLEKEETERAKFNGILKRYKMHKGY